MLIVIGAIVLALVVSIIGLANYWSRTPHGRLKPIFAFFFRLQAVFDKSSIDGALVKPMETEEQRADVRAAFLRDVAPLSKPVVFRGTIEDRSIEGPGGQLPVRIYTPLGDGPFPGVVYFHGGGFIVGSPDYTDALARVIAMDAPAVVVSVDYRLAPESPWPAAVDDAEFAVEWCLGNAADLRMQTQAIVVAGDSAGGNLAAVMAQSDRDTGRGRVGLQVLIYPAVDATRYDRESQVAFGRGYGLSRKDIEGCFKLYVQGKVPASDPRVSPLSAESVEGLPRALVLTAGFDVLRDEGTEYAQRLAQAGVPVEHVNEPSMPHGYITMTRVCREAGNSIDRIVVAVRDLGEANAA